jgi:hypothetical protein
LSPRFLIGIALIATVAAIAGYWIGLGAHPAPEQMKVVAASAAAPVSSGARADRVQVFADGTVSAQIERAPLTWLWDELAGYGVAFPGNAVTASHVAPPPQAGAHENARDEETEEVRRDPAEVLRTLRSGTDNERLAALYAVSSGDATVPEEPLEQVMNSDPSDRIRLEAYRALLQLRATDESAMMALLEAGQYDRSAAVRTESTQRLEMYDQRRHEQAANVAP